MEILRLLPGARTQCAKLWLGRFPSLYFRIWCTLSIQDKTPTPPLPRLKRKVGLAAFWNPASFPHLSFGPLWQEWWQGSGEPTQPSPFLNQLIIPQALGPVQLLQSHWTGMFPQILQLSSRKAVLFSSLDSFAFSGDYYSNSKVTIFNFSVIWKLVKTDSSSHIYDMPLWSLLGN